MPLQAPTSAIDGRPVVFDILAPDMRTSILPDGLRLVLYVNPNTMTPTKQKQISRIQTRGGWVEQHWGDGNGTLSFEMATGGFKRLYTGLTSTTGGPFSLDNGSRRETLAYERYLDLKALFHNNGAVYGSDGQIAFHGAIQVTYDGGVYIGWWTSLSINEVSNQPYMFTLSGEFTTKSERRTLRVPLTGNNAAPVQSRPRAQVNIPLITRADR